MSHFRLLLLSLSIALSAIAATAQINPNRSRSGSVRHVLGDGVNISDSVEVYRALVNNRPVDNDFLNDPVFAIVGKNKSFYFSVGANLKFVGTYDWGNPDADPLNSSVGAMTPVHPGDRSAFAMSAQSSNIYFNIIGFPQSARQVGLFISLALDKNPGNEYVVHASYVYLRYRNLLVGYSTSLYNDKAADPYTIDSHGPIASGAHDNIQINFQKYLSPHIRLGLGIEAPKTDYTGYIPLDSDNDTYIGSVRQRIPDIPFYIGYTFDTYSHLRLSGIARSLIYRDNIAGKNRTVPALGLKFTGSWSFNPVILYAQTQGGKGIASYIQDNAGLGIDLLPDNSRPGRLVAPWSWGCIAGIQYNITPSLFATGIYSYMHNYIDPYTSAIGIPYDSQLRSGHYLLGNFIYRLSPLFRTGIEYVHTIRNNCDRSRLSNNAVSLLLSMSF